uniref:Transcription factor Tfb2 C-terminal domain-containing protein n=1 Tax=Panagrolaimus davidi TaxID=227884 RepID=A0A914QBZ6_9BILA
MRSNSHPIAVDKFGTTGCVPQTVVDQINLWEVERSRCTHSPGVLYSNFAKRNEFLGALNYAKAKNILKWSSPQNRQLIMIQMAINHLNNGGQLRKSINNFNGNFSIRIFYVEFVINFFILMPDFFCFNLI